MLIFICFHWLWLYFVNSASNLFSFTVAMFFCDFTLRSLSTYPYDSLYDSNDCITWWVYGVVGELYLHSIYTHKYPQSSLEPKWRRVQLHPICIAWRVPWMRLKDSIINPPPQIPHPNHSHQIVKWQLIQYYLSCIAWWVLWLWKTPPPPPIPIWGQSILTDRYYVVKTPTKIHDCIMF